MLKTVLHVHTDYSHDSNASPADVVRTAVRQGVRVIGVTDHDEIAGAVEMVPLAREYGIRVIVGEEVSSADGHIIGLFLRERIPPGLSAEVTATAIREQGGCVLAPHPYTILCSESLGERAMVRLLPWLDAVEVCNAQDPLSWENRWAEGFAKAHGVAAYCGADAHIRGYLAGCYQEMPDFDDATAFAQALRSARLSPGRFPLGYFMVMGMRHVWASVFRHELPAFGINKRRIDQVRRSERA